MSQHEYHHLYKTYKWKKLRDAFIKEHPTCAMCEELGKISLANVVDHINPHRGDEALFFSGPFQSLCYSHHNSTKQRIEKRGVEIGCDKNGIPLNKHSHWFKET